MSEKYSYTGLASFADYKRVLEEKKSLELRIAELEAETKALKENSRWLARLTESSRKENEHLRQTLSVYAAKQRWISVSERLPEDTERMLTIVYDAFEDTTAISILQHYGDGDWFSWDSGRYVVTHWMPLPPNPESPNDTQTQTIVYGKESEE